MRYLVTGISVDKITRIVLGVGSINNVQNDYVSSLNIISSGDIQEVLADQRIKFNWRIISAISKLGGFLVELEIIEKCEDVFKADVGLAYIQEEHLLSNKLKSEFGEKLTEEQCNQLARKIKEDMSSMISTTNDKSCIIQYNGNGVTGLCEKTRVQDIAAWSNYLHPGKMQLVDKAMPTPESEVSFRVPTYAQLKLVYRIASDSDNSEDPDDAYEGNQSDNSGSTDVFQGETNEDSDAMLDYDSLGPMLSTDLIPVNRIHEFYDSVYIQSIIAAYGGANVEDIIGHESNNTLDIQSNEIGYFELLKSLVRNGLRHEYEIYSEPAVDQLVAENKKSDRVDAYLKDISEYAFALNQRHTGYVTNQLVTSTSNDDGDSNGDESIVNVMTGLYRVEMHDGKMVKVGLQPSETGGLIKQYYNGFNNKVIPFINEFAKNSYAWAEAVIKLLRWGSRKAKLLTITGAAELEHPTYLRFDNLTRIGFSGKFDETTAIVNEETGCEWNISTSVWASAYTEDLNEVAGLLGFDRLVDGPKELRFPIGISAAREFAGINVKHYEYIDIFTLSQIIKNSTSKVGYISYKDGNYVADDRLDLAAIPVDTLAEAIKDLDHASATCTSKPNQQLIKKLIQCKQIYDNIRDMTTSTVTMFKLLSTLISASYVQQEFEKASLIEISSPNTRIARKQELQRSYGTIFDKDVVTWYLIRDLVSKYIPYAYEVRNFAKSKALEISAVKIPDLLRIADKVWNDISEPTDKVNQEEQISKYVELFDKVDKIYRIISKTGRILGYLLASAVVTAGKSTPVKYTIAASEIPDGKLPQAAINTSSSVSLEEFNKFVYNQYKLGERKLKSTTNSNEQAQIRKILDSITLLATSDTLDEIQKSYMTEIGR